MTYISQLINHCEMLSMLATALTRQADTRLLMACHVVQ